MWAFNVFPFNVFEIVWVEILKPEPLIKQLYFLGWHRDDHIRKLVMNLVAEFIAHFFG